jgi:hypothetical protein
MNVRLRYSTVFTAGIFYDDQMRMNNYQVKLHLTTNSEEGDDHNIALDRIKYFLHNQLNSTVFINSADTAQCRSFTSAGIKITTLPEEPLDQVVGIMLYCKLNAILENRMIIDEIEICSELGENIVYLHNSEDAQGPFADTGWWLESDSVHCDLAFFGNEKTVALHHIGAGWRDLGLQWDESVIININNNDNKVVFADFAKDETK